MTIQQYARILGHNIRRDGTTDTYWSMAVPCEERKTFQPKAPKNRTPSRFVVLHNGRWRRVYLDLTNPGTHRAYLGTLCATGEQLRVDYLPGA